MKLKEIKNKNWFESYMATIEDLWLNKIFNVSVKKKYEALTIFRYIYIGGNIASYVLMALLSLTILVHPNRIVKIMMFMPLLMTCVGILFTKYASKYCSFRLGVE